MLSGSLSQTSANSAALRAAGDWLVQREVTPVEIVGIGAVPPFVPELADNSPDAVVRFRAQLDAVDAVLIAAPEYAGGLAGSIKNCLDWLVGSSTLYRKTVGVLSVGTTGGIYALEQLVRTVTWQGGLVACTLGISAPQTKMNSAGEFTDTETLQRIHDVADTLLRFHRSPPHEKAALLAEIVEPYGIDPNRN